MNAIGYIRRSKSTKYSKGDSTVVSLDAQRDAITRYCEARGFTLCGILSHDGISGTKRIRFAEIEKHVLDSGAQVLVIYNLDRLARDDAGLQAHFDKVYRQGIRVHETTGGEIPYDKAMDRFMLRIRGAMDQLYAEVVSEKTTDALQYKKSNGQQYTRIPPFGYAYHGGLMVPEPEEQRALLIIRQCHEQALGARRTQRALVSAGYAGRMSIAALHRVLHSDP